VVQEERSLFLFKHCHDFFDFIFGTTRLFQTVAQFIGGDPKRIRLLQTVLNGRFETLAVSGRALWSESRPSMASSRSRRWNR